MELLKNTTNKVALTLSEKASTTNPEWLLKLSNDFAGIKTERVIALYDISDYQQRPRANIFEIIEAASEDLANSIVNLNPTGSWSYVAFEMAPSSPRNMNPSQALKIVETGICLVKDPDETKNNFFDDEENKNSVVFEG